MITGGAGATVLYNLKKRHPTLDLPVIDYDLALLFQPMLMLGISLGVAFNLIFPDWMITSLLIIFFTGDWDLIPSKLNLNFLFFNYTPYPYWCSFGYMGTGISVNAFLKGVNTWKKETLIKKVP